ncbi:Gfo/Idh/MocA family oxidoreductase [Halobacillus sp. ACCC02827]|uniref:Gfo/Idh/MocA family protein n=1 Tax=unclassified Halobacillus TaxID=2636472 RepID=UPI0007823A80|nr:MULTISPECIES: Gfo/Idh/MocA family oxidoreductase [unclassified Halobacillus]WJE15076.1 Gfo/Idh/MocA family oxidoreductase [Halobacillus sp. ACCC02827]
MTIRAGIIGCGTISDIYLKNSQEFASFDIIACADVDLDRAREKAEAYGVERALTVTELLEDEAVDVVINLTPPLVHKEITMGALRNGKHVYSEKPLAVTLEDGREILAFAEEQNLKVGVAPDTFLGAGLQTCQGLMEKGAIGIPLSGLAFMMNLGPERWHHHPEFFYQKGGGPLFDMGPYYLTALIQLLGPIKSIMAVATTSPAERAIASGPKEGTVLSVETPTHYSGILEMEQGALVTLTMSFDAAPAEGSLIELYGTEGALKVPDPNTFGGPVSYKKRGEDVWQEVSVPSVYSENSRGIGLADMAEAIKHGTPFRTHGSLAYHVLEAMHAFHTSSDSGKKVDLTSTVTPSPLREDSYQMSERMNQS